MNVSMNPVDSPIARVRVCKGPLVFVGWKGTLTIDGELLRIVGDDPAKTLIIDAREVKRASYNGMNGLWAMRLRNKGGRVNVQCGGSLLSSDRAAGNEVATKIAELLRENKVRILTM